MKLSKTQLGVLKQLNESGEFLHYLIPTRICSQNPYYFFHVNHENSVRLSTVDVLEKHKLVRIEMDGLGYYPFKCFISEAGKKFLVDLA